MKIKRKYKLTVKPTEVVVILKELAEQFRSFYQFSFWTGLSTGEQLGLKWKDIDLCFLCAPSSVRGKHLEETKNETRNSRVELIESAYQALLNTAPDDYFENRSKYEDDWVFKNPRTNDL